MTNSVVIEYRVSELDVKAINALEQRIAKAEDEATDEMLWEQAAAVVRLLESGMSQRAVAAEWINARTGKAYSHTHVQFVAAVTGKYTCQDIPFRTAYWRVANPVPHVNQNSGDNEWYTPVEYIAAARRAMGGIDLDPASTKEANTVVKAEKFYTAEQDGLTHPWPGRVWLNPPYSSDWIGAFADKLVSEYHAGRTTAACVLVNNASETDWFEHIAADAGARCDLHGRVKFWAPDKSVGAPLQGQVVLYLGKDAPRFAESFEKLGRVWVPRG